jgi:hypothetical protein
MRNYDAEQKELLELMRKNIDPMTLSIADLLNKFSAQYQNVPTFNVNIQEVSDVEQK